MPFTPSMPDQDIEAICDGILFDNSFDISDDAYAIFDNYSDEDFLELAEDLSGDIDLILNAMIPSPIFRKKLREWLLSYKEVFTDILSEENDEGSNEEDFEEEEA